MTPRIAIFALIAGLAVLIATLGAQLPRDIRSLATARNDNLQWTVFQIDTEFANLSAELAGQAGAARPDSAAIRLRVDIALSRAALATAGSNRLLWSGNTEAEELIRALQAFGDSAAGIIDRAGPLDSGDVAALSALTDGIRPDVRRLALLGLSQGVALADAQRRSLTNKLRWFGLVAIAFVAGLAVALFYLDRLLSAAHRKDDALRATTERLTATVAASLDGIVIANEAGEVIDFNEAASGIFGWGREEIIGRKMDDTIVPHQHRQAHSAGMTRYLATGAPHVIDAGRIELSALRKSGEEFPIELNITSARQAGEEIFIAYVRDISERRINEKKLIAAREQAEKTDRAKSTFLAVMSHEMRTPLNGILGVLDLLGTTDLNPRQSRYVQVAVASGEILLEHVNEALDITRIETGVMTLTPEVFSLRSAVGRVTDVLRPLAAEKGLTLEVGFPASMDREFFADSARLNQILTNLIGNAVKFTETGGIRVIVSGIHGPEQTEATISVEDTGPGIAGENLEDIFGDFVALARASGRQSRGDGLGLSISRKVARLMGGDLRAESVLGVGSVFRLTLPLQRPEARARPREAPRPGASLHHLSVLIVEDNAINRSVLCEMLTGLGNSVTEAENGLEGVKKAGETGFDLIIMDISMPFMDGIEATRRIRQGAGPNRGTRILGLTAHGGQEFRQKAEAAGMDRFCTKPLRLSDLRNALQGMDGPDAPPPDPPALIATDVIGELREALGDEKVRATTEQFLAELADGVAVLRAQASEAESAVIADALHKLRGAAALLGLTGVCGAIDAAGEAGHGADRQAFVAAVDGIERASAASAVALFARLTPRSG